MGVSAYFTPVVGDEVTTKTGHFNAFPFPAGTMPPDPSTAGWPNLLRAIRSAPGERVVVLNHPRDLHAGFRPFAPEQFNPVTGEHRRGALGVDALEVINSGAMQSDPMQLVRDWMALRNHGERLTAVGASDSHDVARFIVGQGRTYIACRDNDPARLDIDAACRALKAGRALVSLGLLARMRVNDRFEVGDLATKLGEHVEVSVEVYGPSWSTADRVDLFANGVKVQEARIGPSPFALKARVSWTLPRPPHDVSLVAVASGPGVTAPYWAIARPYQPTSREWTSRSFGITNPIDLDGDGDGAWTSPRAYAGRRSPESASRHRPSSPRSERTTRRSPHRPPDSAGRPAATSATPSLPASWRLPPSPSDAASQPSQQHCRRRQRAKKTTACAKPRLNDPVLIFIRR